MTPTAIGLQTMRPSAFSDSDCPGRCTAFASCKSCAAAGCGWCGDTHSCLDTSAADAQCATEIGQCLALVSHGISRETWISFTTYLAMPNAPHEFDTITEASSVSSGVSQRTEVLSALFTPSAGGFYAFYATSSGRLRFTLTDLEDGTVVVSYDSVLAVVNQSIAGVALSAAREYFFKSVVDTRTATHRHVLEWTTPNSTSTRYFPRLLPLPCCCYPRRAWRTQPP